ncbi:MAG: DNA polymerase III subunit beta [Peptostreptococcaceae bacterium]|jgi:DNA polymerase-3 subunit beta|nr:DNA polymerase III subunit beta [Peptostreptococcaceae bacterium]
MNIVCSQKELSNKINIVQKAISSKTTMPILKGIYLEASNGKLKLIGNDLEMGIETHMDCEVTKEGKAVIDSRLFGEIIKKLPESFIEIELDDENNITISCEHSEFKLRAMDSMEYPQLPSVEENEYYEIEESVFKDMIKQTVFAISQDETKPLLMGELLEINDSKMSLVAIDGYRLAIKSGDIKNSIGNNKVVIPGKTLNEVNRILSLDDKVFKMALTSKHALFLVDDTKIITRLLEGEFLNYKQIIPSEYNLKVKVNTKSLLRSIERASLLAKEGKNNLVKFLIKDNVLVITSNSEIGNVHEEVNIELEGEDLEIAFNSRYLIEVLKIVESEEIVMEFSTNVSPCIIKNVEFDDYIYLLLPVRIN